MPLYTLGLNHSTAPIKVREQVAFQLDTLGAALRELVRLPKVKEAAILSTCNRTEVYFNGTDAEPVARWLEDFHRVPASSLSPYVYTLAQDQAVHACVPRRQRPRLDGVRRAADPRTNEAGGAKAPRRRARSVWCSIVFSSARSRSPRTCAATPKSAARRFRWQRLRSSSPSGYFRRSPISACLLIGAGEMIELAATHFAAKHPKSITVANRTMERGEQLAARFGANAITLNELPDRLAQFDIIITSTASSLPILGKGMLERAIKSRRHTPMFIVDLAVPRDVEPEAAELNDVFLYSVDDLANIVKDNLQIRIEAVTQAEAMITEQAQSFLRWLEGRNVVPTLAALQGHHEQLARGGTRACAQATGRRHTARTGDRAIGARTDQQVPARAKRRRSIALGTSSARNWSRCSTTFISCRTR